MNAHRLQLTAALLALLTMNASATVRYVDLNCTNATPPFTNWSTAATNIQDAVDAADPGDQVLVTNGVYSKVVIGKPVTVQSVNPAMVWIDGAHSNRCVSLGSGATLSGFVVTNGFAQYNAGGVWCESPSAVVSNCAIVWNVGIYGGGGGVWGGTIYDCTINYNQAPYDAIGSGACGDATHPCVLKNCTLRGNHQGGAYYCTLTNCVVAENRNVGARFCTLDHCAITNNTAFQGAGAQDSSLYHCLLAGNTASGASAGGAMNCTLNDCTVSGNSTPTYGGGAYYCTLNDCTVMNNSAVNYGGGAYGGTLSNCTVSGNVAVSWSGGGVAGGTLNNCVVFGNSAHHSGGGTVSSTLNNCLVISNSAATYGGGGVRYGPLNNCTVVGNTAPLGGGVLDANFTNCIVYYNAAATGPNYAGTAQPNYSCMTPLPADGVGNITNAPLFVNYAAGNLRLQLGSPCINAGNNSYVSTSTDLDGKPRIVGGTVDMGAYEFQTHFVDLNCTNPTPPYSDWSTAATNIQDAVDAAWTGDTVLVTNDIHDTGGKAVYGQMTNRVAIDKAITVQSVNGLGFTWIVGASAGGYGGNGDGAIRCVYVGTNAVLSGFALTNGHTRTAGDEYKEQGGGGAWCESSGVVSNCTFIRNSASYRGGGAYRGTLNNCTLSGNLAGYGGGTSWATLNNCTLSSNLALALGGGAYYGTLNNCTLSGNDSASGGGGACWATLNNCTLTGNRANNSGGGAYCGTLNNCIVYYNSANLGPNFSGGCTFYYSCTTPLPGPGNLTYAPLFVDTNGWSNLSLQSNSPCINAGNNSYVTGSTDLGGNPRIVGGTVDIGAYEFQSPVSMISYAWLQQYGLPINTNTDSSDPDGDGMNNWQEWRCRTVPTNVASVLRMLWPTSGVSGVTVTWESVTNRTYFLERSADLATQPPFLTLATNIVGQTPSTSCTDTNAVGSGPFFYRVGVQQ